METSHAKSRGHQLTQFVHLIHHIPGMYLDDTKSIDLAAQDLCYVLTRHRLQRAEDLVLLLAQLLHWLLLFHYVATTEGSCTIGGPLNLYR